MSSLMKSLIISEPGKMAIAEVARPEPKGDELLIRVGASGICGTDVHIYNGDYTATFPLVPAMNSPAKWRPSDRTVRASRPAPASPSSPTSPATIVPNACAATTIFAATW